MCWQTRPLRFTTAAPIALCAAAASLMACQPAPQEKPASAPTAASAASEPEPIAEAEPPASAAPGDEGLPMAPAFELPNLEGETVKLTDFRGRIVVLEWFNPECPFVRLAHTKGSLVGLADKYTQRGVVWLGINSGAPGRQGHGSAVTLAGQRRYKMKHPILLDEAGQVGHAYGAERTPHMFVVDEQGRLAYQGAIDNSPDGEGESPEGGTLVNYVDQALSALIAGNRPPIPRTEPYGCTVKYAAK